MRGPRRRAPRSSPRCEPRPPAEPRPGRRARASPPRGTRPSPPVALTDYREGRPAGWGAYLAGVMHELVALGAAPLEGGARIAVTSEVPVAAGLASSAALTVAAAQALSLLGGTRLQARQLAGVAFRAEHDHVGVRCGIMDQMSAALARPGRALLLECASLAARHILVRGRLLLVDSGLRRGRAPGAPHEGRGGGEGGGARGAPRCPGGVARARAPRARASPP